MPIKKEWIKIGETRIITPTGFATVIGVDSERCNVKLEEMWAGSNEFFFGLGEMALATDFTIIKVINISVDNNIAPLITSAVNYPDWESVLEELSNYPYIQDETLIGLNFVTREVAFSRLWIGIGQYRIISAYYDLHMFAQPLFYDDLSLAKGCWNINFKNLDGTGGHILLGVLFDLEELKILACGLFSTIRKLKFQEWF